MMPRQRIVVLILAATLVRCIIALTTNLGNDEVYYLTYAQHLQWNYFDHPPMVALLIRLTTLNLWLTSDFFVRLGPILLSAVNTMLVYSIGCKIKNEETGFIAALLFTASLYSGIIAGTFILPDAPELFFWILSLSLLIHIATTDITGKQLNFKILLFGLVTGLCIMSKVHGIFLWLGFGLYILFYKRGLLANGYLYLAALFTAIIVYPILIWNINNNFITYTFHGDRVTINHGLSPNSFIREFFGGLFYNNPINYVLIVITLIAAAKSRGDFGIATPVKRLLLLAGLPLILIVLSISLFRDTLPHWSGPGFIALQLLAACYINAKTTGLNTQLKKAVNYSCALITVIIVAGIGVINFYPGTLGKKEPEKLGKGDVTLDMYGWGYFRDAFKKLHEKDLAENKTNTTFIITNKWFPGSHIDNYIAQPLHLDFVAIGTLQDIHTYAWLNACRKKLQPGNDAYFITVSNTFTNPNELYAETFEKINPPIIIKQYRGNKHVRNMLVYLMEGYKGEAAQNTIEQ